MKKMLTVRRSRSYIAAAAALFTAAAAVFLLMRGFLRLIGAGILLLTATIFLLIWFCCTLEYAEDNPTGFTIRSLFSVKRTVSYADLWGVRKNRLYLPHGSIVLAKGKAADRFLEYANRRYQSTHGKRIPKVLKVRRTYDPMNGNVYEPWGYIIILSICFAASFALLLAVLLNKTITSAAAIAVFTGSTVFFGGMLVMLVYVGRNADILPHRFVEFFYKPAALTFRLDDRQGKK